MKKLIAAIFLAACVLSASVKGETIFGVSFSDLVTFDSAAPNLITSTTAITGLTGQGGGEGVIALDFRPANQQLYALGNAPGNIYRLYTIDTATGVATQVGGDLGPAFSGALFGFDFNPVPDRLRIVNDGDQNRRYNPNDGALTMVDGALAYAGGDLNAGANPNIVASAYTNNVPGAMTTTLYGIDSVLNILVTQSPPDAGTLNTIGALGVDFTNRVSFDISGLTGAAFASSTIDSAVFRSDFYTIDLASGSATLVGEIGSGLRINGLTAAPIPEPSTIAFGALGGLAFLAYRVRRRS